MAIDDRFDFFRMHLQASDVDDPIPPADEVVAAISQFEQVAGIDEAVRVFQDRGAGRPDSGSPCGLSGSASEPSSTFISTPGVCSMIARRKARKAIVHVKRHAGLCRGESVRDSSLRIERLEMVQDCLVRDLS